MRTPSVSVTFLAAALVPGLFVPLGRGQPQDAGQITESQKSVSPLIRAVGAGRLETVQDLLAQGADPNAKPSALMLAANKKHTKIVRTLIASGADVNARSESGVTSLQVAVYWRHTPIVKALVEAGADVLDPAAWSLAQKNGYTATLQKLTAKPVTDPQKRYESKGILGPTAGRKEMVCQARHTWCRIRQGHGRATDCGGLC